jgi:hypothetical protein
MYLRQLNDIEQKDRNLASIMKVDCPRHECPVVGRGPCIRSKMKFTRMPLQRVSYQTQSH